MLPWGTGRMVRDRAKKSKGEIDSSLEDKGEGSEYSKEK